MKPKVSAIVTIYNRESYLEQCARSLFSQTLGEIEYIFVDDASTDRSVEVLRRVVQEYPHREAAIKIIELGQNGGVSNARRTGMSYVTGDYVIHTDSDDWIDPDMFEQLYQTAMNTGADIVGCDISHEYPNRKSSVLHQHYASTIHENISRLIVGDIHPSLCTSLTKTALITDNNIIFPDGLNMGEDLFYNLQLYLHATNIVGIDSAPYHYRHTPASSSYHHTRETIDSGIEIGRKLEELLRNAKRYDEFRDEITYRKFSLKQSLIQNFDNREDYLYWLTVFPETHQSIWKFKRIDKKLRLELWLSAHHMFPVAQAVRRFLKWQHQLKQH